MIAKMEGWKVLSNGRFSCGNPFNKWKLFYPKNELTYPTLEGSKLFFFRDIKNAYDYIGFISGNTKDNNEYENVVPCEAYNCSMIKNVAFSLEGIERFWKQKKQKKQFAFSCPVYSGSWVAEAIICLE